MFVYVRVLTSISTYEYVYTCKSIELLGVRISMSGCVRSREDHICVGCFASFASIFSLRLSIIFLYLQTCLLLTHHLMLVGNP